MNSWEIIITPEAAEDIRSIYAYIANTLLSPNVARKIVGRILETIHSLDIMPMRYALYEKEPWHSRGLRKAGAGNYIIFYLPNEAANEVAILHVVYGGQNIGQILKDSE